MTDEQKPCVWYCRRHGALPAGSKVCASCGTEHEAYMATLPGQLTIDEVPA